MKSDCLYCLIFRAKKQVDRLTKDEELRFKALAGVIEIISNHVSLKASENITHPLRLCPSYIGTKRDRFLQSFFNVNDTYSKEKTHSKAQAMKLWSTFNDKIKSRNGFSKQVQLAMAIATTANIIEFDLLNQHKDFQQNLEGVFDTVEKDWDKFSIELLPVLISEISKAKMILYLTDNTGEAIFDTMVVDLLLHQNKQVTVAGKSSPILNDATVADLNEIWQNLKVDVYPTIVSIGTNSVGLLLDEVSKEFKEIIQKTDLIIAKGMGHFETLPEYEWNQSVWCLFRSKCLPVVEEANSSFGKNCLRKIA